MARFPYLGQTATGPLSVRDRRTKFVVLTHGTMSAMSASLLPTPQIHPARQTGTNENL